MAATWYYADGTEQKGPHAEAEIADLVERGVIKADTLVWTETLANWTPLRETELRRLVSGGSGVPPVPNRTVPVTAAPVGYGAGPSGDWGPDPAAADFVGAIKAGFRKYATFSGRAGRAEFWFFILFLVLLGLGTGFLDGVLFGSESAFFSAIATLGTLIPSIAVAVRRLHDTDRTGWWYLVGFVPLVGLIVLIVFWCQRGTPGPNRFG